MKFLSICAMSVALMLATLSCTNNHLISDEAERATVQADFDKRASYLVYGDSTGKAVSYLRELGDCCQVFNWAVLCVQYFGGTTWMQCSTNPKDMVACANKALKLADKFRSLPVQNDIIRDLIIACEGQYLMCLFSARYHGIKKSAPEGFTEDWCKRYAASWRRDNKESELNRVLEVFLGMNKK